MSGYIFKGKQGQTAPRETEYTFYISAKNEQGEYSEPSAITVNHPGIQKLNLTSSDVISLFASLKIKLPTVFSQSDETVYPESTSSVQKNIIKYRVHIQEVDWITLEPIGNEEIIEYDINAIGENRIVNYHTGTGKKFEIKVGAYDSVYHPDYNPDLYEQTISDTVVAETLKIQEPDIPDGLLDESKLTDSLSTTIQDSYDHATIINPDRMTTIEGDVDSNYSGIVQNSDEISAVVVSLNDPSDPTYGQYSWQVQTSDEISSNVTSISDNEDDITYNSSQITQLSDEYTVRIEEHANGKNVLTGFGLALTDGQSEFSILADKFRVYGDVTDGAEVGTPIFGIDSTNDIIFLDASQITMRASNDTWNVFFDLDSEGLSINTPDFVLNKSGDATFSGEVVSSQFSLTGSNLTINESGISANEFSIDSSGNAVFSGNLSAATGTFSGILEATGEVLLDTIGNNAVASGTDAMAIGNDSTASNSNTIAIGRYAEATGDCSTAMGAGADAIGDTSTALGANAKANDMDGIAIGFISRTTGSRGIAIGSSSVTDYHSIAIGYSTEVNGANSIGIGHDITVDKHDYIQLGDSGHTINLLGAIEMPNLPTSDPTTSGQLWNDGGTLKVSSG